MPEERLTGAAVSLEGLEIHANRVVLIPCKANQHWEDLMSYLYEQFKSFINPNDLRNRKPPHITLARLKSQNQSWEDREAMISSLTSVAKTYETTKFGEQSLSSLLLCEMGTMNDNECDENDFHYRIVCSKDIVVK